MAKQTITEKIQSAGKYLGVSTRELENEFVRLCHIRDEQGARELFAAYRDWEVRGSNSNRSQREIEDLTKSNLDYVCEVADTRIRRGEDHKTDAAVVEATTMSTPVGMVRQFYRNSIGYHPVDPRLN